ncbi:C6 transcription factor [Lepidopterella palustris CBS 459.81]|uniref:C6 transcription factor n=1 Tax=Lepidopterella palustris CBS 459.81 TaxID=1314670 RepID=A0A8E2JC16_9PEZI|nr:C6 transcription factor [Lepidopterella palustris CBS 459.81]
MAEQLGSDTGLKPYSCLTCRQRKVKCDRHTPCSNCVTARKQCSFIPPVRGKRKRTKFPKEGLHAKLRRYEDLLKSYGANIEPSEHGDDSDLEAGSQGDVEVAEDARSESKGEGASIAPEEVKSRFVTKDGSSRYFDSAPWSNLGGEPHHPEEDGIAESTDGSNIYESDLFVGSPEPTGLAPNAQSQIEDFACFHPPVQILSKLWDIYVDRADPMMKLLHLPTFWSSLMNALHHPQHISRSLMAVIFAFYLTTISSLEEDECQSLLGGPKSITFMRYKLAARQALTNAGFLHTSSPMTLRAYAMFLMAVRSSHRTDTLFVLSGVAVRLARKMGLHRDGTSLGLSPFETEMRRRLWWHIAHVDFRISDVLGIKPSLDLFAGDTKMPLNVADEDLSPDMADPPPEHNGITSNVICLIKYEIMEFIRKLSSPFPNDVRLEILTSSDITLAKKDSMISQIEDLLERKYLRYCDPSNSLHHFASIMARSSICKMKLFAHNPRRFANYGIKIPQSERDLIFANATKLLEYVNLVQGNPIFDKYKWQLGTSYLWNTILYVLIEARHRKTGPEVDRLWQLIGAVLSKYPQMFEEATGAVYTTLGKWTLDVWNDYLAAMKVEGLPEPPTPEYINAIRRCRRPSVGFSSKPKIPVESGPVPANSTGYSKFQSPGQDGDPLPVFDAFASYDFSDLLFLEMDPNEWVRWEHT